MITDKYLEENKAFHFIREILFIFLIVSGIALIIISFFIKKSYAEFSDIILSIGLTLAPSGIITLFLSRYTNYITGVIITRVTKETIVESLKNNIAVLNSELNESMNSLSHNFREIIQGKYEESTSAIEDASDNIIKRIEDSNKKTDSAIKSMTPGFTLIASGTKYGVENIHINRAQALESFNWFLDSEIQKAYEGKESRIWIVSSSIKGFITTVTDHFDGRKMLERISECKDKINF